MAERLQINADLSKHPKLHKKILELAKRLDMDKSKLTRFALRKLISEVETEKIDEEEIKEAQV